MICKERDHREHPENDKLAIAGAKAEKDMAFYLSRAFVDAPDLWIFNDLRFKDETGDRAQIDHLVLHRHGFIVIESKSVSTSVAVNRQGEWVRFWNRIPQGMPSPIEQAKRQIDFLRRALQANRESLLGKVLGLKQMGFSKCPFEILVAISVNGTIQRGMDVPEVVKADQVPTMIQDIVKRHKKARSLFSATEWNSMDGVYNYTDEEVANISNFLLEHHFPLIDDSGTRSTSTGRVCEPRASYTTTPAPKPAPAPAPEREPEQMSDFGVCKKCGQQCLINWGRYGYYWKCIHCDNNMPIKDVCPSCNQKIKLRKDRNRYFSYCDLCKTGETLYCEFECA